MLNTVGQRVADFVGTTGVKVVHAVESLVPGVEPPPPPKRLTAGRVLKAATAVAAGLASASLLRKPTESASTKPSSRRSPTASKASRNGDLRDKSRGELYELARKADIEGRSSMTKDELVRALTRSG